MNSSNHHNPTDRQVLRDLKSLGRLPGDETAAARAVARAIGAVEQANQPRITRLIWWKWAAPVGIAAAVALVMLLGPRSGGKLGTPTWADVLRQTAEIKTAYIDMRNYENDLLTAHTEAYMRPPATIRAYEYQIKDGKEIGRTGSIMSPDGGVRWNEQTRLGEHLAADNPYVPRADAAETILAMLGVSLAHVEPSMKVVINNNAVEFTAVAAKCPGDSALRGFGLKTIQGHQLLPAQFAAIVYWFDEANMLKRITAARPTDGDEPAERLDAKVDLQPNIPRGWFDAVLPPGYTDIAGDLRARLSPEVRAVYDAVAAAREKFGDYRAVIWRDAAGGYWVKRDHATGWPMFREGKHGEQWRFDALDWIAAETAIEHNDAPHFVATGLSDPFAKIWGQAARPDSPLDITFMRWHNRFAEIYFHLSGRGPRVSAGLYDNLLTFGNYNYAAMAVRFVAWPQWVTWENMEPSGADLRQPPLAYRLLPPDPKHPELIDVVGERDPKMTWSYVRYTLDRDKDYLCVRQELRRFDRDVMVLEITQTARTADGHWVPRRVHYGMDYDYAVERGGPADGALFAWPAGVPEPQDAFYQLQHPSAVVSENAHADLPPTAKGKYISVPSRGLPRGFATQKEVEAFEQMIDRMRTIEIDALGKYAAKRQWKVYPEKLSDLVTDGDIKPEVLHNPLHPDADPPFGYIRPNRNLINSAERMVLYEPFTKWPGVVTVMFQDESIEHVHSEAEFEKLLKEATAVEPPSRPYDH